MSPRKPLPKLPAPSSRAELRERTEKLLEGLALYCPLDHHERMNNLGWKTLELAIKDLARPPGAVENSLYCRAHLDHYFGTRGGLPPRLSRTLDEDCEACGLDGQWVLECAHRAGVLDHLVRVFEWDCEPLRGKRAAAAVDNRETTS